MKSVDHPTLPDFEKTQKYVRSNCTVSAFIFAPSPDGKGTWATRVVHVDPKGSLPAAIVNTFKPTTFNLDLAKALA